MSNLSELLPSGGGQNVVEFTASGAVGSGKPVILNTNGTVTEVAESAVSESLGTAYAYESGSTQQTNYNSSCYDTVNGVHVIAYQEGNSPYYGYAVVATPSGQTISYGTPVNFEASTTGNVWAAYASVQGKILISWNTYSIVGEVSGTSITFGSSSQWSTSSGESAMAYSTDDGVFVVVWDDSSNYGSSKVGSISGSSISFGSTSDFETDGGNAQGIFYPGICYTTDSKMVVAYLNRDASNNKITYARVGTISGTSISWGARTVILSGSSVWGGMNHRLSYDPVEGKVLISYTDETNSDYLTVRAGTISGTTISFGTAVVVNSANLAPGDMVYNSAAAKTVIYYPGYLRLITLSGTTPVVSSATSVSGTTSASSGRLSYNSTNSTTNGNNVLLSYAVASSGGSARIFTSAYTSTNLTAASFIGLASAAISDTATGNINVKGGINEAQTGLTIGSDYYVQSDGTVSTTSTSPAVKIGQAISATTINMMDLT